MGVFCAYALAYIQIVCTFRYNFMRYAIARSKIAPGMVDQHYFARCVDEGNIGRKAVERGFQKLR